MRNSFSKATALFLAVFISVAFSQAQDITGQWNGVLSVPGVNLRIVFHIDKTESGYTSKMDSPDQGVTGIPVTSTILNDLKLTLAIPSGGILYEGEFQTDSIVGTFNQGALSIPMNLKKGPTETKSINRPQEPKPPYPYRSEDITFENKAVGITLAGTLTMPETGSNFTAVILISGSGAQNRNEEIMGHKPFLVIADYLTRNGIAVLRYDDRGTAQSTGDFHSATTADFASDAESAVAYLKSRKEINSQKIGIIGHSEGGIIAPMVAAQSKDVCFIVMLAGSGMRGDKVLLMQNEFLGRASGMSESMIDRARKLNSVIYDKIVNTQEFVSQQEMVDLFTSLKVEFAEFIPDDNFIRSNAAQMTPWVQYFLRYDPVSALQQVKCPVLAVNGSKDLQVTPKENLEAIGAALKNGGNNKVTIKEYPNLNHLFQECTTGLPAEYAIIEQTFSPDVLKDLASWILTH